MAQKLYRSETDRVVAGLCGGLGEFFDVDSTIIRIIFIILTIWGGVGLVLYIIGVLVVPESSSSADGKPKQAQTDFTKKVNQVASEIRENIRKDQRTNTFKGDKFLGLLIIVIGAIFLVQNFFPRFGFHLFWPVVLIIFGLLLISGEFKKGEK